MQCFPDFEQRWRRTTQIWAKITRRLLRSAGGSLEAWSLRSTAHLSWSASHKWTNHLSVWLIKFYMMCWVWFGLNCRWHSAGTFYCVTKTGGPFGTMRFTDEQAHEANSGIQIALGLLDPVRVQFPTISFADFHQVRVLFFKLVVGDYPSKIWILTHHVLC